MTIESNRMLGGIGACFTLIGAVSSVSSLIQYAYPNSVATNMVFSAVTSIVGVLSFVGFILFLIAMYGFSKAYGEHRIFDYILYGLIITIVAAVIAVVIIFVIIFSNIASIIPSFNPSTTSPSPSQITSTTLTFLAPVLAVLGFVSLIDVVFNVRAFNLLGDKSQVRLFRTAAKVLLAGALLTVVLGIVFAALASSALVSFNALLIMAVPGGIVQDVAWALLAIAFFRIRALPTQTFTPTSVQAVTGQVKYCPNCGAQNQPDAIYCTRCGKKQ